MMQRVLIGGSWRDAQESGTFQAENPETAEMLPDVYPVSDWADCDEALTAACCAATAMRQMSSTRLAEFLECYAARIEGRQSELVELAHLETGLPASPRLAAIELPRTTGQLRQAAEAARQGSWSLATIDTAANIRSCLAPIGPVAVFGPNNFPFAFGSASGGDFAAAIAAGNPVIAKANSSHPGTTRLFAEEAQAAAEQTGMPAGIVQLIYRTSHADGEQLVSDPRLGATGYTGSREAGLKLKEAADRAGKPIYLELSSINPVVLLPGALRTRRETLVQEFCTSSLMGSGQFCTNPGLILLLRSEESEAFINAVAGHFAAAPVGTLLSRGVQQSLQRSIAALRQARAELLAGDAPVLRGGYCSPNTLLKVTAEQFLADPAALQIEAFGNACLLVVAENLAQLQQVLVSLEGNLTGCIYTDAGNSDDAAYDQIAPLLLQKVGRLLNDKMPTGVAVSSAMNHGGPYPATGHPGFTAVGIPAALRRFAVLQCYDGVRETRLPVGLRNKNPNGTMWRFVDGCWTRDDIQA